MSGSSPRVRGTHLLRQVEVLQPRFIPACAGNSRSRRTTPTTTTVHPRVCGELFWCGEQVLVGDGSSPRVRGTRSHAAAHRFARRFIPACAGNSVVAPSRSRSMPGSSPRVRGTRLIPWSCRSQPSVHPRVCGELAPPSCPFCSLCGSSPRVRGTLFGLVALAGIQRFIPACAGNSATTPICCWPTPVHPRVCGELRVPSSSSALTRGSSPRVRGTRAGRVRGRTGDRFIPACAGNSAALAASSRGAPVHPRVCGELLPR